MGLKQKIKEAKSDKEIIILLCEGQTYKYASYQTVNSWHNEANKRRIFLKKQSKRKDSNSKKSSKNEI